ncbi:Hypothetical predicted protein [Mytilus galloprovincialis]|uniref:Uncharacterized protein n=1 Tax=Mytilus galloprovincialis TaxID=29158 RepID=A0A8B6BT76_MYTGA|nr:Hypothetical predicted protein [Mytilus galloprovincialis]
MAATLLMRTKPKNHVSGQSARLGLRLEPIIQCLLMIAVSHVGFCKLAQLFGFSLLFKTVT